MKFVFFVTGLLIIPVAFADEWAYNFLYPSDTDLQVVCDEVYEGGNVGKGISHNGRF